MIIALRINLTCASSKVPKFDFFFCLNSLTHLFLNHLFSTPWKHSENRKVFSCFQGVEKRCIGNKWAKGFQIFKLIWHFVPQNTPFEA